LINCQIAERARPIPPTGLAATATGGGRRGPGGRASGGAAAAAPCAAIAASRQSANCCVSFFEISDSRPRDIWAAAPTRVISACIITVV
jgi:hypothetical protein